MVFQMWWKFRHVRNTKATFVVLQSPMQWNKFGLRQWTECRIGSHGAGSRRHSSALLGYEQCCLSCVLQKDVSTQRFQQFCAQFVVLSIMWVNDYNKILMFNAFRKVSVLFYLIMLRFSIFRFIYSCCAICFGLCVLYKVGIWRHLL